MKPLRSVPRYVFRKKVLWIMMKFFLLILYSVILTSCAFRNYTVQNAQLIDLISENKVNLTDEEVDSLNRLLKDGIEFTFGEKWQAGNLIRAESNNKKFQIFLYKGGYLKISDTKRYYKVKSDFIQIFDNLNRNF